MKKFLFLAAITVFIFGKSQAQMLNPVKWNYSAVKVSEKVFEVHLTAT